MCGRFTLKTPVERLSEKFQFPEIIPLKPRYNIAPSQSVAVVRLMPDDTDRKLAMLRWGLLPVWVKDPAKNENWGQTPYLPPPLPPASLFRSESRLLRSARNGYKGHGLLVFC